MPPFQSFPSVMATDFLLREEDAAFVRTHRPGDQLSLLISIMPDTYQGLPDLAFSPASTYVQHNSATEAARLRKLVVQ